MKNSNTYALLIDESALKTREHGTLQVRIVRVLENGQLRNPETDDAFNDLVFRCQWDADKTDGHTYGWQLCYRDCYVVDLGDAKRMLKTLQRVEKVISNPLIRPVTFGQFVVLMASALGIKSARKERRDSPHSSSYSENIYFPLELSAAQYAIDELIAKSREPKIA